MRLGLWLALLALLATMTGCTLVGAGIGASEPRSVPMKIGLSGPLPAIGEEVSVLVRRPTDTPYEELEPEWLDGRYLGIREDALLLSKNRGQRAIALGAIRKLVVHRGTYLNEGLGVGILVDCVVVLAGVAVLTSAHPR